MGALLTSGMKESNTNRVELPNISYPIFQHILSYLYTARLPVFSELGTAQAKELLQAANYLSLHALQVQFISELSRRLENGNVGSMLQFADAISSQPLKEACMKYIQRDYLSIVQGRHFECLRSTPDLMLAVMYASEQPLSKRQRCG